ncbi:MAG: ribosome biogenesis GTPase Der, partial [Gammaproteobacteria bacterium]
DLLLPAYGRSTLSDLLPSVGAHLGVPGCADDVLGLPAAQRFVVFVVDGREGLTPHDLEIARELRRTAQHIFVAVNKTEGMSRAQVAAEFHELGLGEPYAVSAAHGDGVRELVEIAFAHMGDAGLSVVPVDEARAALPGSRPRPEGPRRIKVAVVGRPNAGKSTLINTLLGEERLIAFDQPGTTRDAVAVEFERGGRPYTLIDTAGVRRRGKVTDVIEKFSIIKTLQAIEDCNVCVLLLDAGQDVSEQDATIAGYVLEAGRALVVAINKWDAAEHASSLFNGIKAALEEGLSQVRGIPVLTVSAKTSKGIDVL